MSRSRKKVPIVKDRGSKNYNKIFRKVNKMLCKKIKNKGKHFYWPDCYNDLEDNQPLFKLQKETTNQYDVIDWIYRADKNSEWGIKLMRK